MQKASRLVILVLICAAVTIAALTASRGSRVLASLTGPMRPAQPLGLHIGAPSQENENAFGQPRRSPHETTTATIDGSAMSIVYGRPSMRGRVIFGQLVPFDQVWCPGADECTKLTTSRGLRFQGLSLPAGAYTLWMRPTSGRWTLIVNADATAFHTRHNPREDLGTITLEKQTLDAPVEQLTFEIAQNAAAPGGSIVMSWETTRVSAPFLVVQ